MISFTDSDSFADDDQQPYTPLEPVNRSFIFLMSRLTKENPSPLPSLPTTHHNQASASLHSVCSTGWGRPSSSPGVRRTCCGRVCTSTEPLPIELAAPKTVTKSHYTASIIWTTVHIKPLRQFCNFFSLNNIRLFCEYVVYIFASFDN